MEVKINSTQRALVFVLAQDNRQLSIQGDAGMRWTRAFFLMLGKLPELQGQLQFWLARTRRAAVGSFDYKS